MISKVPTLTRHIHSCIRPTGRRRALRLDLDWPVVSPDMANMATDLGGNSIGYIFAWVLFSLEKWSDFDSDYFSPNQTNLKPSILIL